uniref:Transmembrane protein n=1 Tax=Tetradesmus obliquus TaxID=3088 RepID=A0A383WDB9_TETOB|eukprot:jgi/Sobl393_1/10650/SZX74686.1
MREAKTLQSSSSLLPSGLALQLRPVQQPAPDVVLPAQTSSSKQSFNTVQEEADVVQPLRRKHQQSAVYRAGRRQLLLVWMPWSESNEEATSSDSSSMGNSSSNSSSNDQSVSSDIKRTSSRAEEPSPTENCSGKNGRSFYAQIRVLLALDVRNNNTAMSELEKQVSTAIARQLRLLDSNGDPDAARVMCWVDTGASEPGQTWLEAYVWLSPANCEVTAEIWQSLVSSNPQALFDQAADPQLSAAVQNVTILPREPTAAQYVKMGVQGSRSYVQSIAVSGTAGSSSGNSWSTGGSGSSGSVAAAANQDYEPSDGIYMMTPFVPGPNFTGLMVMGITTVSVFVVLALLTIMSKWAERRVRHEQEAAAEAAVQQATAAAAAAAERFRNAEAAALAAAAARSGGRASDAASSRSSRSSSGSL